MSANIIRGAGGIVSWKSGDSFSTNFATIGIIDLQNCNLTSGVYAALARIPDNFGLMIDSNIFDQDTMDELIEIEYLSYLVLEPEPVAELSIRELQEKRPDIMVTVLDGESSRSEYPSLDE